MRQGRERGRDETRKKEAERGRRGGGGDETRKRGRDETKKRQGER